MALVAGIDSSTQSCKVMIRDADDGTLVRSGRARHPDGTEVHPQAWLDAAHAAIAEAGGLDDVGAVSVGAQQHGMVCLDADGEVIRDALLWNDVRSASAASELISELGGAQAWADRVGVVPVAAITAAKLRWLADTEPDNADRTAAVCLPHDWLSWSLRESHDITDIRTDRSDASGTGYFSAEHNCYDTELLTLALRGRTPLVPDVVAPTGHYGQLPSGAIVCAGAGDNAAATLAVDAQPGDVIISLGTSGVVCTVTDVAAHDGSGQVAGFADATGMHLPLVCTLNGAPVLAHVAGMLGVDLDHLAQLALSAPSGADGAVLIPYFAGERTPDLPDATATICGLRADNMTPAHIARAAVEGLMCSLADGVARLADIGARVERVLMVGGGVRSAAIADVAPRILGVPVVIPEPGEYVADGAARQAAWALSAMRAPQTSLPTWAAMHHRTLEAESDPAVLDNYRQRQVQVYS